MDLSRDESTRRLRRGSGKEVKEQILSLPSGSAREDNEVHEKAHGSDGWAASEAFYREARQYGWESD